MLIWSDTVSAKVREWFGVVVKIKKEKEPVL